MKTLILVALVVLFPSLTAAQDMRPQVKFVTHATVPANPDWYPTGWVIANLRNQAPDNINFMMGVGRKFKTGWVEGMLQRQYAFHTEQWFLDFRYSRRLNSQTSMFVEVAPFLGKAAVFNFVRVERRTGPINLLVESENILRRGQPDLLGIGPGVSLPARKLIGRMKFAPAISWQIRNHDPHFVRFYIAFPF